MVEKTQMNKEVKIIQNDQIIGVVNEIIDRYPVSSESLMPILQDIQDSFHYLPEQGLKEVAKKLQLPLNRVYAIATFYNAFSLKPKGKYIIQVCMGTACHLKGAPVIMEKLISTLKIKDGNITEDGLFSVESVRCLGCCSIAPVININGKVYGNVKSEKIGLILNEYKK